MINAAAVAACPGIVPTVIDDPTRCGFDPASLLCSGADAPNCLTAAQVEAVRKIYAGPRNPRTGARIHPGTAIRGSPRTSCSSPKSIRPCFYAAQWYR